MGTFLVTRKMSPALAARIERSVGASRRFTSFFRLGLLVVVVIAVYQIVMARYRSKKELERARAELLEAVRVETSALGPDETGFMARIEPWLAQLSRAYEGDYVADDLRAPTALDARLAKPSVYVRGPIAAFASAPAIAEAAAASSKDAFILCLLDPPASRAEKTVASKVRASYAGNAAIAEKTAQARRLHDVDAGVKGLKLPWADRARAAEDAQEMARIRTDLSRVPVDDAKRAARAELLVVAMDEADASGPTELDGERAHSVRVGVVEVPSGRVLVRLRRHVDPSLFSPDSRVAYASALDACALAFDVRASVAR